MSLILMCKEHPIYNINTEEVLNPNLLPGIMKKNPCKETYNLFSRHRYSSQTNVYSRRIRSLNWGQGNRNQINIDTYSLSLSDCYWIRGNEDTVNFYDITPYLKYKYSPAEPTLYTNGFKSKYWLDSETLIKNDCNIELLAYDFCSYLDISINKINKYTENEIAIKNFTSLDLMLEPASLSGLIDPEDFTTNDILKIYDEPALNMIVVDSLLGNGDRHAGNFGILRSTNTGDIIGFSPLYDFDHTFDSKQSKDILTDEIIEIYNNYTNYQERILYLCKRALTFDNEIIKSKASYILNNIQTNLNPLKF